MELALVCLYEAGEEEEEGFGEVEVCGELGLRGGEGENEASRR